MDDQRHAAAMTDDALERDIARALAVDPAPDFVARVRTRIANEPAPSAWRFSLAPCFAGGAVVAVAIVLAIVLMRPDRASSPAVSATLAARAIGETVVIPNVGAGLSRTVSGPARGSTGSPRATLNSARPELVEGRARITDPAPLLDPRETQALRSFLAGVRNSRMDLTPLLRPGAQAPIELPPVDDLVIAPIAIEPIAPQGGAQGERQ
jgi:hypothetical protein